ncbi:hypothetical protein [Blastopirellula marina]|uniref:Tetratricopeptide repeat protein n=1 Tax=Blastopirellula marina TaxID=124 RepID=A0A2S8G6U3_9BACT|nr:hypothetical protein [Blastopirellula marina]PQO39971.1 hypothetical protein C5Y98_06535 [Blastopirellula marina]PTL45346.1 hypothetical protein C5Y97_06535 [Blastopirellula marina]
MNNFDNDRLYQLWDQAEELPYGEIRVRISEEAVNLAESARDLDLIFDARLRLIESAGFSGHDEKLLAAFAWCLAQYEKDPPRFEEHRFTLLWYFKHAINSADQFPQISLAQVDAMRAQMSEIYGRYGYNQRPFHYSRFKFAVGIGELEQAAEAYKAYRAIARDDMSDCTACETNSNSWYFFMKGDFKKGLRMAQPILQGRQRCMSVPHVTYANVLRPLALLGRYEEADQFQKKGYRLIRSNPLYVDRFAMHIAYLVHRDRRTSAVRMFERHLAMALETHELSSRYEFLLAAQRLFTVIAEKKQTQKLNLPTSFALHDPTGQYDVAQLLSWIEAEAIPLGERFNARNQNKYYTAGLVESLSY